MHIPAAGIRTASLVKNSEAMFADFVGANDPRHACPVTKVCDGTVLVQQESFADRASWSFRHDHFQCGPALAFLRLHLHLPRAVCAVGHPFGTWVRRANTGGCAT